MYSSTHLVGKNCPLTLKKEDYGNKYIWPVYDSCDIFVVETKGNHLKQLTFENGCDAEQGLTKRR